MRKGSLRLFAACALALGVSRASIGGVVINEFQYDDTGAADDREFVELYNNTGAAIDISGWTLGGRDQPGLNTIITIPAATSIAAGGYYVIGNTGTLNVNQTAAAGFLENDAETIELRNGPFATGVLQDAVVYEANKGPLLAAGYGALPADVAADINVGGNANSPGYWANSQGADLPGTPLNASASVARYFDGVDTNNNGRDFGTRPSTPGTSNLAGGSIVYTANIPNVDLAANESDAPGLRGSFVNPKVIDPTVISASNSNIIPASPQGGKAITVVDNSGGGNAAYSVDLHQGTGAFSIYAYLDTSDFPTATWHETTTYGTMGQIGALFNLPDPEGDISVATAPGSAGDNTGVAWLYQKFGSRAKLYLVDAGDGGNSSPDVSPVEWAILASYDLSAVASGWHELSISVDSLGSGVASYDGNITNFTTAAGLNGEFYAGYREGLGAGTPGAPGAGEVYRPATFDIIPEPASLSILGLVGLTGLRRRRQA